MKKDNNKTKKIKKDDIKKDNNQQWHPNAKVICACGNTFTVGSTQPVIHTEVCFACHPLFTGEMRYIDAMGRVERFEAKRKAAKERAAKKG